MEVFETFKYIPSKKSSAQVGIRVNSVLTRKSYIKRIYRCLFCNIWMHPKLKSKVPLRNCEHFKRLGVTPQKW